MKDEFVIIKEELKEIISSALLSGLLSKIDDEIHFINKFRELIRDHLINLRQSIKDELKFYNEIKCYNTIFLELLKDRGEKKYSGNFDEEFSELTELYNGFFRLTDNKRIDYQDIERFRLLKEDSVLIKILKVIKSVFYFISTFYGRTNNLIRKVFKDYEKPLRQWKRKIHFRNLLKLVIRNRLLINFLELIREMNRDLISALQTAWMAEEKINNHFTGELLSLKTELFMPVEIKIIEYEREINSALKTLQKTRDSLIQNTRKLIDNTINELDILYQKAGTIEYLSLNYPGSAIERNYNNLIARYKNSLSEWNNTFYILSEDWKFRKDLYINEILNVRELYLLKEETRCKVSERIIPELEEIEKKLSESKTRVENGNKIINLKEVLSLEKSTLSEYLRLNLIPELADLLLDEQIPGLVDKLELNLKSIIERTYSKRAVVKTEIYNREIRSSEIEYLDPAELIKLYIFPDFLKETYKLKSSVVEQIDQIQKELNDIYEIANYNLVSAAGLLESDNKNLPAGKPESIAAEGLHRSISKVYEIKSKLLHIYENILSLSSESIALLNKGILELKEKTADLVDKKSNFSKTKQADRIKQSKVNVKNHFPLIVKWQIFFPFQTFLKNFLAAFRMDQEQNLKSGKASNFLSETGNAISKLPYVYQRLFRIEPLEDEKFYEQRISEMNLLNSSFENWINGKNSPIVLIGEKGSGITTIINIFLKNNSKISDSYEIIRGKADVTITDEEELIRFLGNLLRINSNGKDDIINILNMPGKKIIVLEKLQHLFLIKIGGFKALKLLFEIISGTTKNVFWLLTSNIYAWNYMDRVLNISEYFECLIKPNPLSDKQISDIILRRHRVSGYSIIFKPSARDMRDKKFLKLNPELKQEYLKEKYFSQLNKFAKSNLSISLLFWMRSTDGVKDDTMTIGSLEDMDFSFLRSLNDEKFFTLNSLIVHDGLTPENHSEIFNQDIEKSRHTFHLLNDDGIITKNKIGYIINPVLYRHTVRILQTKNILY